MAIVESFKHWRHYLEGSQHTIEVWSDHQNLQTFMKQPRINGRQARWLIYLTPYDFIIRHRPGSLNPADGPSRRPDYMAQKEPTLIQKDLLADKLVESSFTQPRPEVPNGLDMRPGLAQLGRPALPLPKAEELMPVGPNNLGMPKLGIEPPGPNKLGSNLA